MRWALLTALAAVTLLVGIASDAQAGSRGTEGHGGKPRYTSRLAGDTSASLPASTTATTSTTSQASETTLQVSKAASLSSSEPAKSRRFSASRLNRFDSLNDSGSETGSGFAASSSSFDGTGDYNYYSGSQLVLDGSVGGKIVLNPDAAGTTSFGSSSVSLFLARGSILTIDGSAVSRLAFGTGATLGAATPFSDIKAEIISGFNGAHDSDEDVLIEPSYYGDANLDGTIGFTDYSLWSTYLGDSALNPLGTSSFTPVPEPSSLALCGLAAAAVAGAALVRRRQLQPSRF